MNLLILDLLLLFVIFSVAMFNFTVCVALDKKTNKRPKIKLFQFNKEFIKHYLTIVGLVLWSTFIVLVETSVFDTLGILLVFILVYIEVKLEIRDVMRDAEDLKNTTETLELVKKLVDLIEERTGKIDEEN